MPVSEIVEKLNGEQIVQRVTALGPINGPLSPKQQRDADALLGLAETPKVKISQALTAQDLHQGQTPRRGELYQAKRRYGYA